MTSRYLVIVLAILCLSQMHEAARLVPRSADEGNIASSASDAFKKAEEAVGSAFTHAKDSVKDLLNRVPSLDDIISGVQENAKKLSSGVEDLTKRVASSINSDSSHHTST